MEKRELAKKALDILKLTLGVLLLVIVYAMTSSFISQASSLESPIIGFFVGGIASFLIIFLFIWPPIIIYKKGQRILEIIFSFFAPLVKTAPYTLPIYTIFIFIIYVLLFLFKGTQEVLHYAIFFIGFSLALHIVFTGAILRPRTLELARIANYVFGFCIIYILNMLLCAWFFSLMKINFDFGTFFTNTLNAANDIYTVSFKQLFSIN